MSVSEAFMSGHELLTGSDRVKSSKKKKNAFFFHVIYPRKAEILVISTM